MNKLPFLLFLLVGCAEGSFASEASLEEEPYSLKKSSSEEKKIPALAAAPGKECSVTKSQKIEDCKLFFLACDDGDDDLLLSCPIVNLGAPIKYQDPI